MNADDYKAIACVLESVTTYALIPIGRAGSLLLHGLLDSHPEVISLPGIFYYPKFWEEIRCRDNPELMAEEFIWHKNHNLDNIRLFISKYDFEFGMDELGEDQNRTFTVDPQSFKSHFVQLMAAFGAINANTVFLALHAAYALARDVDLLHVKMILLHAHDFGTYQSINRILPEIRYLCIIRNPADSIQADLLGRKLFKTDSYNNVQLWSILRATLMGMPALCSNGKSVTVLKLEELNSSRRGVMMELCKALNLSFDESLLIPTFNRLSWACDKLTKLKNLSKKESNCLQQESCFYWYDLFVLDCLLDDEMNLLGYSRKSFQWKTVKSVMVIFLLPLPMKLEMDILRHHLVSANAKSNMKNLAVFWVYYLRRVALYFAKYRSMGCNSIRFRPVFLKAES